MRCTRAMGLVALLALLTDVAVAQEDLLDEPRRLEQITFTPPTTASIRLTNGVRRTGKIVSISRESMVFQVGRDNNEVTVDIDEIQRVNTRDNEFTYEPAKENFERLKIKARRISFLTVQTVETYVPPPEGFPEAVPDGDPTPADPPQPGIRPETTSPPLDAGSAETHEPTGVPAVEIPDDDPQPGQLILFCSNCQGRLPLTITNGDKCPHCGLVLYNLPVRSQSQPQTGSGGAGQYPEPDSAPGYPEVTAAPTGAGGNGGAAPAGNSGGGGQIMARGFDLSDVPLWMQVGFFVGLLAIGWLLLQRR